MVRTPTVDRNGIRRGAWSEEEDNILKRFVLKHGSPNWRQLPRFAGLSRCGKSCRLRWKNYLNPKIKRGNFTDEEVEKIIKLLQEFGKKWSLIASKLPGRTDNEIKNYWHTHLKNQEKNSENLDQIQCTDSMDQVSTLMSTSQSIQMKDIDSNTEVSSMNCNSTSLGNLDSMDSMDSIQSMQMKEFDFIAAELIPELSSINCNSTSFENLDSMDNIQEQHKGVLHEPYLLDTSNDLISQSNESMDYDLLMSKSQSMQMKEFDYTAADSFSELSSMNCESTSFENLNSMGSTQEQYDRILQEFFLLTTSNDLTTQSTSYDLSMSKSFDFTAADSFPEVSMDSFPKDFGEIQLQLKKTIISSRPSFQAKFLPYSSRC